MKKYFYAINKDQQGPFFLDEILIKNLDKNTLVWYEGLPDWVRLSEIPELNIKKDCSLPPPIRVKGSSWFKKNFIKILSIIVFIGVTLIVIGIFLYPKWENEKRYEEALSVYMRTDSIQFEVFNELAIEGHTKSNFILGLYYIGLGNSIKAKESLEKAIVNGNEVPVLYVLNSINPKDSLQYKGRLEGNFVEWVNDISDSDWISQLYAGKIYHYGIGGLKPDPIKAIDIYDKAYKNGSFQAILSLGIIYYFVKEVQDYNKSLFFLKKADELGSSFAAGVIGDYYMESDYNESIYWFTKGAKMNDILSEYLLGFFHSNGGGFNENIDSAKYWYQRVLDNNEFQIISNSSIKEMKKYSKEYLDRIKIQEIEEQIRISEITTKSNSLSFEHQCKWCGKGFNGLGYFINYGDDKVWAEKRERWSVWASSDYCTMKCATEASYSYKISF